MPDTPAATPPQPPIAPSDDMCCGSGCTPCVWDFYYDELTRYREELAQWQAAQADPSATTPQAPPADHSHPDPEI